MPPPTGSDRHRRTFMPPFSRNGGRHQYGHSHSIEEPQQQPHPRAHVPQHHYATSHGWQSAHAAHQGGVSSTMAQAHRYNQRIPQSMPHHHHQQQPAPPAAAYQHTQQHKRQSAAANILDKWFKYGLNNRKTDLLCDRCGEGGHEGEDCPKNLMRCQYCGLKVDYRVLCDHQLSCPKRMRTCHTCHKSIPLSDFFEHASVCRVAYAKGERISDRLRSDHMVGA